MKCIPDSLLDEFALQTKVDHSVSKLKGKLLLQLFIYSSVFSKRISQRILSSIYSSPRFKTLFKTQGELKFSSISMRLQNIKVEYFEKIFESLVQHQLVETICFGQKKLHVRTLDSTFITLSSKLLQFGMDMNRGTKNLKFGVMIEDGIPVEIKLFKDNFSISDNKTFVEQLRKKSKNALQISIFDRGLQKIEHFSTLKKEHIHFISRLTNTQTTMVVSKEKAITTETQTLKNITAETITLGTSNKETFRLITAVTKETDEKIRFITNIYFLSALEVTELYRGRWEIEIFFKFIKQELNFSHLLSRNENGIKAVMYLTMITAILLMLYKKANNLLNWVIIKMKFFDELEEMIMKTWNKEIFYGLRDPVPRNILGRQRVI